MLILASSSPRRRQLLGCLQLDFEVVPSGLFERPPLPREAPDAYALALARAKADDVAAQRPEGVILAADTVVAVDGAILGKPQDEQDAVRMLQLLSGRQHAVTTAVAVRCGSRINEGHVTSRVTMRGFSEEEARRYAATGESMDKAGAYAVQGLGGTLVDRVDGCYNTVVGLPLCLTSRLLSACGIIVPESARGECAM